MEITFKTRKLETLATTFTEAVRKLGHSDAVALFARLQQLQAQPTLGACYGLPGMRMHQLVQDRDEQWAADVGKRQRLIMVPSLDPIPRLPDGGVDRSAVTAVMIIAIEDYHK